VVWLRRAAESAISAGSVRRSSELSLAATQLTEQMLADTTGTDRSASSQEHASDVDALLGSVSNRLSAPMPSVPIDIEVDLSRVGADGDTDTERSLATVPPATPPPSILPILPTRPRTGQRPLPPPQTSLPMRPPPPPRAVRPPPARARLDSDPTFVTSAPPLNEVLEQQSPRQNELTSAPAQPMFSRPSSRPPEPEEVEEFPPSPRTFESGEHSTLAAPPPVDESVDIEGLRRNYDDSIANAVTARVAVGGLANSGADSNEVDDDLTLGDEDFSPSSDERSSTSEPDSDATLQDVPLDQLATGMMGPRLTLGSAASQPPMAVVASPIVAGLPGDASIAGISLTSVEGLQDLPEEAQHELVSRARLETLAIQEEISDFGVALVLSGWVTIMPTIADAACAHATTGAVVFTVGTLSEGIGLRVVSGQDDTLVAVWDAAELDQATQDCPWVADELRVVADRFQALAGVTMGAMGDRLDDSLRALITDRCEVKTMLPYEVLVDNGSVLPGLHIVGGGRVEIIVETADGGGEVEDELGPGDFLFAPQVLGAGPAPATARAGKGGALVLFADRMTTHELLVSVPPLLEILAG
jgi:hypothetical protein